jgi:transposase
MGEEALEHKLYPAPAAREEGQRGPLDFAAIHEAMKRKGVTLQLLWEEYRAREGGGYGYSRYCELYHRWKNKLNPSMRQVHRGGEKMFVDYAGQTVPVTDPETGEKREAVIFVAVLGASHYLYVEAQERQDLAGWIGGHERAFAYFGGVPEVVVPDNLKAGVKSPCRYEPDLNPTYHDLAVHYGTVVIPARVGKPKDKAKVEVGVQVVERWILARLRDQQFFGIGGLNAAIRELREDVNTRTMKRIGQSRKALYEKLDKPALKPLPIQPYEFAIRMQARVGIDYHVAFRQHYYSVPFALVGQGVEIKATEKMVRVYHQGACAAQHLREDTPHAYTTQEGHMPPQHQAVVRWTPQRFMEWAETIGVCTREVVGRVLESRRHPEQTYRSCLGILGLERHVGKERLERACTRALQFGIFRYQGIKSILTRGLDRLGPEEPPPAGLDAHEHVRGEGYYQ